jgi:hypothetical protein
MAAATSPATKDNGTPEIGVDGLPATAHPSIARRTFAPALHDALARRFGATCSTGQSVRDNHARGESPFQPQAPDAVVFAQTQRGVTACHNLLAMQIAGLPAGRLYPGSWSEWCSDAARPIRTGALP